METKLGEIASRTRERASSSRRSYNVVLVVMLVTALAMIFGFLSVSISGASIEGQPTQIDLFSLILSTLNIGAILLAIFLIQILFSFARYHVRLAHRLDAVADALELLPDADPHALALVVAALAPDVIDFSKPPRSPTEKAIDAITEVARLRQK